MAQATSIFGNVKYGCLEREVYRTDNAVVYYRPHWHEYVVFSLTDGRQRFTTNDRQEAEDVALAIVS